MVPLSAVLITKNEEKRLPAALESLRFCDERVVVDCGSTDHTRETAEAAGARVVVATPWPGFVAQRRRAVQEARHDWVLVLDADERVTPALRDEIQSARAAGFAHAGYRMPRVAFYLGRWIRATDWYPDLKVRLFDRRRGDWQDALVHESVVVQGTVGRFHAEIEHRPYEDIAEHLRTIDDYTTLWAREAFEKGRGTGTVEMAAVGSWAFLRNYLLKRGILLGRAGLTVSILNAFYAYAKLAKLDELNRENGRAR